MGRRPVLILRRANDPQLGDGPRDDGAGPQARRRQAHQLHHRGHIRPAGVHHVLRNHASIMGLAPARRRQRAGTKMGGGASVGGEDRELLHRVRGHTHVQ